MRATDSLWIPPASLCHSPFTAVKEYGPFEDRPSSVKYRRFVTEAGAVVQGHVDDKEKADVMRVLPLRLLKRSNTQQMAVVYELLRRSPALIQHYLCDFIFPQLMQHQKTKLTASGQVCADTSPMCLPPPLPMPLPLSALL